MDSMSTTRSLFKTSQRVNPAGPTLRYCELVGATASATRHIRIVPEDEEPCYSGGIKDLPLCEFNFNFGRDFEEVTLNNILGFALLRKHTRIYLPVPICWNCVEAALILFETKE